MDISLDQIIVLEFYVDSMKIKKIGLGGGSSALFS
jgi:hypothetical protein